MGDYKVFFHEGVIARDLKVLPRTVLVRIFQAIGSRLTTEPAKYGLRLRKSLRGLWRIRVGDYRIAYTIEGRKVSVWGVVHRSKAYEVFAKRWNIESE